MGGKEGGDGEDGGVREGVPLLNQLVGAADELQLIQVVELVDNLGAKKPPCTARADLPCVDVFGVRPNKIAEGTLHGGENGRCKGIASNWRNGGCVLNLNSEVQYWVKSIEFRSSILGQKQHQSGI